MSTIFCSKHGKQEETFVCQHIVQGLNDGMPRGFWWARESDANRPDAWCTLCNELVAESGGAWTDSILEIARVRLLCANCYDEAKAMNLQSNDIRGSRDE